MSENLFLIINYESIYLNETIPSLRKFYINNKIVIVNNNLNIKTLSGNFSRENIHFINNIKNNFELGAIWYGVKYIREVLKETDKKLVIIHNTTFFLKKIPEDLFLEPYVPFFTEKCSHFSPMMLWVENKLKANNIDYSRGLTWNVCQGLSCIIDINILYKMIDNKYDLIYASDKNEAVGTEILFSYLIIIVFKMINYKTLHKYPLNFYYKKKIPWEYITYISRGQGSSSVRKTQIGLGIYSSKINSLYNNSIINNFQDKTCINFINIFKFIDSNDELILFLINIPQSSSLYTNNKNITEIINRIRQIMFTKIYFNSIYKEQKSYIEAGLLSKIYI